MGDESGEAAFVMACEPVDGEAAVAGTHCAYVLVVDIGFTLHVIDCAEVVAHVLTAVVFGDLCVPFGAESGKSATVGGDDDISVGCHQCEIPAVAPELAHGLLRTSLTVEDGGIFLVGVEFRGIDNPCGHQFAVGCGNHAFLYCRHLELRKQFGVDVGDLLHVAFFNRYYLVGHQHGVAH